MHLNSELIFKKYALPFFKEGMKVLEVGPYGHPSAYQKIINNSSIEWQTLNLQNDTLEEMNNKEALSIIATDPYAYPVASQTYDLVLSGNVMEHVEDIHKWYTELVRILRPGGFIVTVMPWSWPYHKAPLDCWRIYPDGFNSFVETFDLDILVSVCESLEFDHLYPRIQKQGIQFIPGRSIYWEKTPTQVNTQIRWTKLVKDLPFFRRLVIPIEVAYDTLHISKKP
jgi:SAM-dependent methyltransferase